MTPNFYTEVIQKDPRFHSTDRCSDIGLLEPATKRVVQSLVDDAQHIGITLVPWETYRSQARQTNLFVLKATKLKTVGVHHYGLACDLVKWIDGKPSWDGDWKFLRDLAKNYRFITGYDWGVPSTPNSFVDACHLQRVAVVDQAGLFAGIWYPGDEYHV